MSVGLVGDKPSQLSKRCTFGQEVIGSACNVSRQREIILEGWRRHNKEAQSY